MAHRQSGPLQYGHDSHPTADSRRSSTSDVFSDTHALSPFEAPAVPSSADDGDLLAAALRESSPARRSLSIHHSVQSRWNSLRRSGSLHRVAKRGSVSSRPDGSVTASTYLSGASSDHETVSLSSMPRRMTSNASSIVVPRTASPYHGPVGPSHPYAMYHQDTGVGRTPSNATSSTARTPLRSYTGTSGPSHPYAMYAQNTVSEDDVTAGGDINPALPLGFTGAGHRYRRRLGPEGEDADDIIGPDGHTEQLPPYTRYPNDVPPESDPMDSIGNTSDPFADPQSTQNTSPIEYVNNTNTISVSASTPMNPAPEVPRSADEGGHYKEVPPARSKRRKCGIVPLWLLVLVISILVAVLVGSIVGAAIHRHHGPHKQQEPQEQLATPAAATVTVTNSLMDAKPLSSTPSNFPPAPTGSFSLSMWNSSNSKADCLSSDTNYDNTWACARGLKINIQLCPSPAGHQQVQILFESPPNSPIRYGPQPPKMSRPADLRLVTDQGGQDRGPAYFFQQLYDKVVVIRESEFANVKSKRWHDHILGGHEAGELEQRHWFQEDVVSPADNPWYCFWNNTAIEGFIYMNEGTNGAASAQSTPAAASSAEDGYWGSLPSSITLPSSMMPISGLSIAAAQVTAPPGIMQKRQDTDPPLTQIFKLEELRGARRRPAYCQQMEISSDNVPSQLAGKYVQLNETEPSKQARLFRPGSQSTPKRRRDDGAFERNVARDQDDDDDDSLVSSCGCEWLNQ